MINNTLHSKLMIEQHESHKNPRINSGRCPGRTNNSTGGIRRIPQIIPLKINYLFNSAIFKARASLHILNYVGKDFGTAINLCTKC